MSEFLLDEVAGAYTMRVVGLAASVATAVLLWFVWRRSHQRWIGWLQAAWTLWAARYALGLVASLLGIGASIPLLLLRFAMVTCLVMVLRVLRVRWVMTAWAIAATPVMAAALLYPHGTPVGDAANMATHIAIAAVWFISAGVVAQQWIMGPERWLSVAGLALYGVTQLIYVLLANMGPAARIASGLAVMVHTLVASGIAVGARRAWLDEQAEAEQRVLKGLEYVVRGVVPMCAYCRSIRDSRGEWLTMEAFVAESTAAPVADVLCPTCRRETTGLSGPGGPSS